MFSLKTTTATLVFTGFIGMAVFGALIMEYSMQNHSGCATATFTGGTCYATITLSQDIALGLLAPLLLLAGIIMLSCASAVPTLSLARRKICPRARAPDDSFIRWLALFELSPPH